MHKYIIMGVQGCGKGTQAEMLKKDFDFVHIDIGAIFRWNIQSHTKMGAKVNRFVRAGKLIPDEIVNHILRDRLEEHDWHYGFILDGFPRNPSQTEFFLENYDIDAVIFIKISDKIVLKRILSRRLCSECGLDYNLIFHRPKVRDICDVCGGNVISRPDDNEGGIKARINKFHSEIDRILELFGKKERIVAIDGTKSPENVQSDIRDQLGLVPGPKPTIHSELLPKESMWKSEA